MPPPRGSCPGRSVPGAARCPVPRERVEHQRRGAAGAGPQPVRLVVGLAVPPARLQRELAGRGVPRRRRPRALAPGLVGLP
jgi:hypothetical protein